MTAGARFGQRTARRAAVLVGAAAFGAALAAGCAGSPRAVPRGGASAQAAAGEYGAASAPAVVEQFVAAARVSDPRAMGLLFGTAAGPVAGRDPSDDVEKRMRALACYLAVDSARVTGDSPAIAGGSRRYVNVALRQRELTREVRFTTVPTARGRWLVESFDIERVSDFCRPGG